MPTILTRRAWLAVLLAACPLPAVQAYENSGLLNSLPRDPLGVQHRFQGLSDDREHDSSLPTPSADDTPIDDELRARMGEESQRALRRPRFQGLEPPR